MLVFVIPLMSPKVANSWEYVCRLFERCIKSVCNQTSANFRVVVVCNQRPQIEFSHPHITYLEVDLPLPELNIKGKTLDRGYKILRGLLWARDLEPSHVMAVDADDCVSKRLCEFVEQNSQGDGWFIHQGYVYKDGSSWVVFRGKNFYQICGTCNIVKFDLYDLRTRATDFILNYHGGHKYLLKVLEQQGKHIEQLPFAGATYVVENGENYYNDSFKRLIVPKKTIGCIKSLRHYRLLTNSIRNEFCLYRIDRYLTSRRANDSTKRLRPDATEY